MPTTHPDTDVRVNTASVAYRVTVAGQTREFSAESTMSGDAAGAATNLAEAVHSDVSDWLRAQRLPRISKVVTHRAWWGVRRVVEVEQIQQVEPAAEAQTGTVWGSVEVSGAVHEYSAEFATLGNPFRAARAALSTAKDDLWNWAWDHRVR